MTLLWLLAGSLLAAPGRAGTAPLPAPDTDTTDAPRRSFSAALSYGSNSAYFGRTQATAFPYLASDFTYSTKGGLFASVGLYNLLNTPQLVDETDLSVGWNHDIGKTLDASLSYSHFFFPTGSELVKSSVSNAFDAGLGQDWGAFYSRLSATYLFGNAASKGDAFLVLEASRSFETKRGFGANDYFSVEPMLSAAAGTQSFAETSVAKRRGVKTVRNTRRFDIVDYEFSLPLTYTVGKLAVSAGWRYVVPVNVTPDDVDSHALSIWTAGLALTL